VTTANGTDFKYKIEYDGADVRCYKDDVEIAAFAQVGYSMPAGFEGNAFVGLGSIAQTGNTGILFRLLKSWDLP
jgi:hypothetical protein